jgi:EmrB/QacA subfamily drug resistance transporter
MPRPQGDIDQGMNDPATTPDPHAGSLRRTALVAANLAAFLTPFMSSAINVAMPSIGREFSLSAVALGWVATAFMLLAAMCLVPLGRVADIVGRKRVFAIGLGVHTVATVLAALAPSGAVLIAARGLQGLGGAMIFGTAIAVLTSVFQPGERGQVLGWNTAATYLGLSLGPVLGGFLVHGWGWRSIFWATALVSLAALVLVLWKLDQEWAEARGEGFDWMGSVVFGLGLVALMYGFSRLRSPLGLALTIGGLLALAGFVRVEARAASPVLDLRLFRANRIFLFSNLAALINYSSTWAVGFLLSLYLQYIKGLPPQRAGLVLIAQPVMMALCSPFAGKLSDRSEPRIVASLGMSLTAAALVLFGFLRPDTPFTVLVAGLAVLGLGFGLFSSPNTNAIMGSVDRRFYGVASATLGTMRLSGQMLSAGTTMMIFSLFLGRNPIVPEFYPAFLTSVRTAFVLYALLCTAGVFASMARGNRSAGAHTLEKKHQSRIK